MQHVVCEWMTGELLLFRIHSTSDSIADGWMSLDNLWALELKFALNPCVFVVWLVGCLEHHQFSSIFIGPRRHGHSTICLFLLLRRSGFCLECSTLCCCWWMTVFRDYYEKFVHKILCPEYLLNGLVIVDNIDCVAEELENGWGRLISNSVNRFDWMVLLRSNDRTVLL